MVDDNFKRVRGDPVSSLKERGVGTFDTQSYFIVFSDHSINERRLVGVGSDCDCLVFRGYREGESFVENIVESHQILRIKAWRYRDFLQVTLLISQKINE